MRHAAREECGPRRTRTKGKMKDFINSEHGTLPLKERKYVSLTTDTGFKAVFADRSNSEILVQTLNLFLPAGEKVDRIEQYLDREKDPDFSGGKRTSVDLVCRSPDGRHFIVEMQVESQSYFFPRCMYYASKEYRSSLESGGRYDSLRPVFVLSFLSHSLPHAEEGRWWSHGEYVSDYTMRDTRTGEVAERTISCIFVELGRFRKRASECRDNQDTLLWLFKHGSVLEGLPSELPRSEYVEELMAACELAAFPSEKRRKYESDMINEMDIWAMKDFARKEGVAEGKAAGLAESTAAIARRMLENGLSAEMVSACTGLDEQEVKALAAAETAQPSEMSKSDETAQPNEAA